MAGYGGSMTGSLLLLLPGLAPQQQQSFDMRAAQPPAPLEAEDGTRLIYELHLTNFADAPLTLTGLDVVDPDGKQVARFENDALARRTHVIGGQGAVLAPGARAVIYIEIALAGVRPKGLRHLVRYTRTGVAAAVAGAIEPVAAVARTRLGPPVRGGPWVAVYNYDWPRGHRRVFYAVDGRARLPGRFAIDWMKLGPHGEIARGDADLPANTLGYGEPVLAVADARVVRVRGDMPESPSVSRNPAHPLEDKAGNHVVLALPDGRYAIYEHLRPGTVKVAVGDRVRRGQVIAALGFTGDSTGPHLHFHVADAIEPLAGEGQPYALTGFTSLGRYRDMADLGKKGWEAQPAVRRANLFPASGSVVRFD